MEPCWIFPICSRNFLLASHARRLRARGYVSLTTDNHQLLARDFAAPFFGKLQKNKSVSCCVTEIGELYLSMHSQYQLSHLPGEG